MQASDKLRSDIARTVGKARLDAPLSVKEPLRILIERNLPMIPPGARDEVYASFSRKYDTKPDAAVTWLGDVCSVFLDEYEGSTLTKEDWIELRDIVNAEAGDFDIELLSRIMSLVLDNGAL